MEYSELLAGGSLINKQTFRVENQSFSQVRFFCFLFKLYVHRIEWIFFFILFILFYIFQVLHEICDRCKLKLVEKIDDTASLFSRTLTDQNVCILLKSNVSWFIFRKMSGEGRGRRERKSRNKTKNEDCLCTMDRSEVFFNRLLLVCFSGHGSQYWCQKWIRHVTV